MLGTLILLFAPQATVPEWIPTHRIHLLNGNSIDGVLLRLDSRRALAFLRLPIGEMAVRFSEISRMSVAAAEKCCLGLPGGDYRIHGIRPRTKGEKAVQTVVEKEPREKEPEEQIPRIVETPVVIEPSRLPTTDSDVRRRVDEYLKKIRAATESEREGLIPGLLDLGPGAAEYLADLIDRTDEETALWIVTALQGRNDPRSVGILTDKLKSKVAWVRWASIQALSMMIEPESVALLRPSLQDPDPAVRMAAISAVEKLLDEESLEPIARLTADPDPGVGRRAGVALGILAKKYERIPDAVEMLTNFLPDVSGKTRAEVIEALWKLGDPESAATIVPYVSDSEPAVRISAVRGCGELKSKEAIAGLAERLREEPDRWVKVQICNAFDKIRSDEAIGPLIDLMEEDEDSEIDEAASRALQHITGQREFGQDHDQWREWWNKRGGEEKD